MNAFTSVETEYISSYRTIETVLISNSKTERIFYVYNYDGYSFRVFNSVLSLLFFFEIGLESDVYFDNEIELDNFFCYFELP